MHRLETLLESTVDKSFDKFEIYTLRNILTVDREVGGWVRLAHYEVSHPFSFFWGGGGGGGGGGGVGGGGLGGGPPFFFLGGGGGGLLVGLSDVSRLCVRDTSEGKGAGADVLDTAGGFKGLELPLKENTPTPERIAHLRRRKHETAKLNALLKARQAGNARLVQEVKGLTSSSGKDGQSAAAAASSSLAFLKDGRGDQNLTTQAQFATSQLPALRELVGRLRPRAEKLRKGRKGVDVGSSTEERRRYIESGVRRVVERSGIDAGEGGVDMAVGEGRRTREDVDMLEGVLGTGVGAIEERRREEQEDEMEE